MKISLKYLVFFILFVLPVSLVKGQSIEEIWLQAKTLYQKKDYQAAFPLMLRAAEKNHPKAQSHIGMMYGLGQGCRVDFYEAVKWYKKAAEQGDSIGQYNLGIMYLYGNGTKQDYNLAIYYLQKASEQNNLPSFAALGYMVENGYGCAKNFNEAIVSHH